MYVTLLLAILSPVNYVSCSFLNGGSSPRKQRNWRKLPEQFMQLLLLLLIVTSEQINGIWRCLFLIYNPDHPYFMSFYLQLSKYVCSCLTPAFFLCVCHKRTNVMNRFRTVPPQMHSSVALLVLTRGQQLCEVLQYEE